MKDTTEEFTINRIIKRLSFFFTDEIYTKTGVQEELITGDIFYRPNDVLPFLQTALLDEKILEVELDGMTRVYFSRLHDHPPELVEEESEEGITCLEPEYKAGEYLKEMSHIISLPLEPGIGNLQIRHSRHIVLRFFMTNYAVEMGCFFQDMDLVRKLPVLRLSFPSIGRVVRGAREFRAKVPKNFDLKIIIVGKRRHGTITTRVVNISASGVSFSIKKDEQNLFKVDETRTFEFMQEGMLLVRLSGIVRHVSKIRGRKGTEYVCGMKFDLITRTVAGKVEAIVAAVQRAHLKEISNLSDESGLNLKT